MKIKMIRKADLIRLGTNRYEYKSYRLTRFYKNQGASCSGWIIQNKENRYDYSDIIPSLALALQNLKEMVEDKIKIKAKVRESIYEGEITRVGDSLIYHSKSGPRNVGKEDDLVSCWNIVTAIQSSEKRS